MSDKRNYHLVNLFQTNDERKEKYWLVKTLGCNSSMAQRLRDWPLRKIERRFGLEIKSLCLYADGAVRQQNSV